jgi:DNA polymerase-3 subunit delta
MGDLTPESVLNALNKGVLAPFYLFYGLEDFWLEITLDAIKKALIPESLKEFNVETLYGGEISAAEIINRASLLPFMSSRRLVIVRATQSFAKGELDRFVPYVENPVDSTCIIWVWAKTELSHVLCKRCRELGRAVHFRKLSDRQVYSWIQKRADELGLVIERDAAAFLNQAVGNSLRDLFSELSKLSLRHSGSRIGLEQIKELTTFSRLFTVFDVVDFVGRRDAPRALQALTRLFDAQGRDSSSVLGILGMLARQIRLLLKTKESLKGTGGKGRVAEKLRPLPQFVIEKCIAQEKVWDESELEKALLEFYDADGMIRTGSRGDLVVESLIFRLCSAQNPQQLAY